MTSLSALTSHPPLDDVTPSAGWRHSLVAMYYRAKSTAHKRAAKHLRHHLQFVSQESQISHTNWLRLALNRTNLGLFKISSSTFWLGEPKCTETDLKKSKICPILGQSNPIWMPNLRSLRHTCEIVWVCEWGKLMTNKLNLYLSLYSGFMCQIYRSIHVVHSKLL